MDCREVGELLDAYSLGATELDEARALEEHVADCVRCWEELNEAQRSAALLSLSVPLKEAPASLRSRILAEVEREGSGSGERRILPRLRLWPAAAASLALAGVTALVFAAVLQIQMGDLRDDNSELALRVQGADQRLGEQRQILAVLSDPNLEEVSIPATSEGSEAWGVYRWSPVTGKGFVLCNNPPPLQEGQVYQVWFILDGEPVSAGTFAGWDGVGQLATDLSGFPHRPDAIGLSIEAAGGRDQPGGEMFLYAPLPHN